MIAIVEEESRGLVPRERVTELLRGPRGGRVVRHGDVHDASASCARRIRTNKSRQVAVGTTKKSAATIWPM